MIRKQTFTLTGLMAEKYPDHVSVSIEFDTNNSTYTYCDACRHYAAVKYICWPLHGMPPAGIVKCDHYLSLSAAQIPGNVELYVDGDGNRCAKVLVSVNIEDLKAQYRFLCATGIAQMEDKSYPGIQPELEGMLNLYEYIMEQIDPKGKDLACVPGCLNTG